MVWASSLPAGQVKTYLTTGKIIKIEKKKYLEFQIKEKKEQNIYVCDRGCQPFEQMSAKVLKAQYGKKVKIEWTWSLSHPIPEGSKYFEYDMRSIMNIGLVLKK